MAAERGGTDWAEEGEGEREGGDVDRGLGQGASRMPSTTMMTSAIEETSLRVPLLGQRPKKMGREGGRQGIGEL